MHVQKEGSPYMEACFTLQYVYETYWTSTNDSAWICHVIDDPNPCVFESGVYDKMEWGGGNVDDLTQLWQKLDLCKSVPYDYEEYFPHPCSSTLSRIFFFFFMATAAVSQHRYRYCHHWTSNHTFLRIHNWPTWIRRTWSPTDTGSSCRLHIKHFDATSTKKVSKQLSAWIQDQFRETRFREICFEISFATSFPVFGRLWLCFIYHFLSTFTPNSLLSPRRISHESKPNFNSKVLQHAANSQNLCTRLTTYLATWLYGLFNAQTPQPDHCGSHNPPNDQQQHFYCGNSTNVSHTEHGIATECECFDLGWAKQSVPHP